MNIFVADVDLSPALIPTVIWVSCIAIPVIVLLLKKSYEYNRKQKEAEAERRKKVSIENRERGLEKAEELVYELFPGLKEVDRSDVNQVLFKRLFVEYVAHLEFYNYDPSGRTPVNWDEEVNKLRELGSLLDETGALFGMPKASEWIYEVYNDFLEAQSRERYRRRSEENFADAMSYFARLERRSYRW